MQPSYWDGFAQAFHSLGSPLTPSPDDVGFAERTIGALTEAPRVLILGVTPAIATMGWPDAAQILAVDRSFPMTRLAWPGDVPGKRRVVCADWLAPPLAPATCDVVIGDGSVNSLAYPSGVHRLACVAAELLRNSATLILRCFLRPEGGEAVKEVLEAAETGAIQSFHAFKLRLLMAAQRESREGVGVDDVYRIWRGWDGRRRLPGGPGWEETAVAAMEYYRGSSTRYAFPTQAELQSALLSRFELISTFFPHYELGERCPTLVLRARSGG